MKESDWKVFKAIKSRALEQFCARTLDEFRAVLDDESMTLHERYLQHYKRVHERDELMSRLFDGHSRSRAWLQLLGIRGEGLVDEELVSRLSDEFRRQTDPDTFAARE